MGLIDLEGKEKIPAGKTRLISIPGEHAIVEAVGVDLNNRGVNLLAGSADFTLPDEFSLDQNYPNPFNPTTTIAFELPQASHVKVDIFNVLGQVVTTLVDEKMEAGEHSLTWDASSRASGIYLYRITAGDFIESKRMVLMK